MTSSTPGRGYHQDYIARIRYSNALPPPPLPPKLLDVPNTGLSSGQYTSAGFTSRLHREQPINIEADAELGMPINLVGIPGVFEGDESAICAPLEAPTLHPHDRALLKPLASLGKQSTHTGGVSFLRRTEYITSAFQPSSQAGRGTPRSSKNAPKKRRVDANKEEPLYIARAIAKGFDLAYPADAYTGFDDGASIRGADITEAEREAWERPQHPRKGDAVRLLDAYPLLPDWDALPQGQGSEMPIPPAFATVKFLANPVGMDRGYDERLDVAFLMQRSATAEEKERFAQKEAAHRKDPVNNPRYLPKAEYTFFLPDDGVKVRGVKRKFDVLDPDNDDDALYGGAAGDEDDDLGLGDGKTSFKYNNIRVYETYQQRANVEDPFESVALALHDSDGADGAPKGAYFYPIVQQSHIRQKGKKFNALLGRAAEEDEQDDDQIDVIEVKVRDYNEDEQAQVMMDRAAYEATD